MNHNIIKTKLHIFSSSFFPAIISAFIDNTDILSLSILFLAAARFRERSVFLLIPIYAIQYLINETNHRISLTTRKGLMDLIRERFGIHASLAFGIFALVSNLLLSTSLFLLLKELSHYITFPVIYFYIYIFVFLFIPVFFKKLKSVRKLFLINSLFLLPLYTFLVLGNIHFETLLKPISFSEIMLPSMYPIGAALFGVSFPFWTYFFIGGYISTNNISIHRLEYDKLEQRFVLIFSGIFQFLILLSFVGLLSFYKGGFPYPSFMMIIYYVLQTVSKLRYIPTILMVFSCLFGLIFISLSSSYILGNFFGIEALPNEEISGKKSITYFYMFVFVLSFLLANLIHVRTISFIIFTGIFNFGLLLFLISYLFILGNSKNLMGRFRNTYFTNISMIGAAILIFIVSVLVILNYVFPGI